VNESLHRNLLRLFRRLPRRLRIAAVHALSPSYTVGGVCIIEGADGDVLLVRHSYRAGWGVPGGLCRSHEEIADAARREAREEVGVDVLLVGEPAVVVDPGERRVDVVYAAQLALGVEPATARPVSPEIVECRWFPAGVVRQLALQPEAADAIAALDRLRAGPP
jgi:ADP-ribose pyrophosphatase YjhB (NUDIX family)